MNLLKLKKYEGLVSDNEHGHSVHTVNQIMTKGLDMTDADRSLAQTDGFGQKYIPLTNSYSKQVSNQQQQAQMYGNRINRSNHTLPLATHAVYMDT